MGCRTGVTGRSAVIGTSSPYVFAWYAASGRSSSSSRSMRPSPAAWRSASATLFRSSSEIRSIAGSFMRESLAAPPPPASSKVVAIAAGADDVVGWCSPRTSSTLAAIGTPSYDVRGVRRPAAASQGLLDLREELVPSHAESEQGQPQHPSSLQRHVVLPDRVPDDLRRPTVLDAVALHDEVPRLPAEVDVVGA